MKTLSFFDFKMKRFYFLNLENRVLFYVMIFETTFQNLVVLIIKIKADIFCYMRFALFRNNN